MPWLEWMWSYFTVVSGLLCLCLHVAMTVSVAKVLCSRGVALRSPDLWFGAGLCFLGTIYIYSLLQPTMLQWIELLTKQFNSCHSACEVRIKCHIMPQMCPSAITYADFFMSKTANVIVALINHYFMVYYVMYQLYDQLQVISSGRMCLKNIFIQIFWTFKILICYQWFLNAMAEDDWWPQQILIKCPNQMVRQASIVLSPSNPLGLCT